MDEATQEDIEKLFRTSRAETTIQTRSQTILSSLTITSRRAAEINDVRVVGGAVLTSYVPRVHWETAFR
ncbi:hypothetical protein D8S78_22065 [Natrialba swarupiae]|nr:hypothetical protein [Natrialba swarupiae]